MNLPMQPISEEIILDKYAKDHEKSLDGNSAKRHIRKRVAVGLSACEENATHWEQIFFDAQEEDGVVMAGRINSAAGTDIEATLINCYVQPVADTASGYVGKRSGIYIALQQAAETMRRGGGEGFNFSYIRPEGAKVKGTGSRASGPISFMEVFNSSCVTVESAGARRGAMMGILNVNHPSIRQFIAIKESKGKLDQFNLSVGVNREFMVALMNGDNYDLVHEAEPIDELIANGSHQRPDGLWVYETVKAQEIWDLIMTHTYEHADPGVIFFDRVNEENNLWYCELIDACNPCGEQFLPDWSSCCLGSMNLTAFITYPKSAGCLASDAFDWERFKRGIKTAVRMLDNVLTVTYWPLDEQKLEGHAKRRIGLGFTGLGSMLALLGLRYDSQEGRDFATSIATMLRDEAYRASIELAREKGPFPLFDSEKYLQSKFVQRLPKDIQEGIAKHGIRNSHLLSIAPTGTISIAFADNASGGVEPAFSWTYKRNVRGKGSYDVMDHAYRLYLEHGGNTDSLPESFVSAMEISPENHLLMVAAIAPMIDSAISKTINVPVEFSRKEFQSIYRRAYELGLKGVTTYRPNAITGAVLEVATQKPADLDTSADRKIRLEKIPKPALASLRWPKRPDCHDGNPSVTYMVKHPVSPFAVFVGHIQNGHPHPFEVWVNGEEQPRGIGALAKTLSMDMRSEDQGWLKAKLDALAKTAGQPFEMRMPGDSSQTVVASEVSALARLVSHRCNELGVFETLDEQLFSAEAPLLDAMFSAKEPKSGTDGTLSWTVDVSNPATGDDFALFLKELVLPDGSHRPYSMWMSGEYPNAFVGLCKSLSLDMRIIDPAWIGKKLRSLRNFPEPQGDFMARIPGLNKMENQPSTVAYIARLIIHRYQMLGILDADGYPVTDMGIFDHQSEPARKNTTFSIMAGKLCAECGVKAVIKKDGCEFCSACGAIGACG